MRKKLKSLIVIAIVFVAAGFWVWQNPVGKFGYHTFGFTVYSSIPFPNVDLRIHADGFPSVREKSHYVSMEELNGLIEEKPYALIIGTGYNQMVQVDERYLVISSVKIEVYDTTQAIKRFNELKNEGKQVAMIIHSTC